MKRGKYALDQSALYKCGSKKRLAEILGIPLGILKENAENPQYHIVYKPKKNSTEKRKINTPGKTLKRIQGKIYKKLQYVKRPKWVMAGEKGKNWPDNAEFHKNSCYVLKFDIANFFPNCGREYVYRFFLNRLKCAPDIAEILTDLTTYHGCIIQGSPVSMVLAFYAYEKMFDELANLADENSLLFSTYVDDLTFSSKNQIQKDKLIKIVNKKLHAYDHKSKSKKEMYYGKTKYKKITGVILYPDHVSKVPNRIRLKIKRSLAAAKEAEKEGNVKQANDFKKELVGTIYSARQIEKNIFPEALNYAKQQVS